MPAERYFFVQVVPDTTVRKTLDPTSEILDRPPVSELLRVIKTTEHSGQLIYQVSLPSGREGFLSSRFVQREIHDSDIECESFPYGRLLLSESIVEPIRRSPSTRAPVITEIWPSESVVAHGVVSVEGGNWYEVGVSSGSYYEFGWVWSRGQSFRLLVPDKSDASGLKRFHEGVRSVLWVGTDSFELREAPDEESRPIRTARVGDLLSVDVRSWVALPNLPRDEWLRVRWRSRGEYAQAWIQRWALTADHNGARRK
ncbi:MAG: SH3 domain-containing protein, partial [Acidobacteria bacterium]